MVWSDILNAMRGFKNHSVHSEVLGWELSNFSRQLQLKPGIDDNHRVIVAMSNDLWFRGMEKKRKEKKRKKFQGDESSLGSDGADNETRG